MTHPPPPSLVQSEHSQPLTPVQLQCFRLAYAKREAALAVANEALHADLAPLYAELDITPATQYRILAPTEDAPAMLVTERIAKPELVA